MIQEARAISQIHDYVSFLLSAIEVHPDNEIMLQQHAHWSRMAEKLTVKFQKKYGHFPVSLVEEGL